MSFNNALENVAGLDDNVQLNPKSRFATGKLFNPEICDITTTLL